MKSTNPGRGIALRIAAGVVAGLSLTLPAGAASTQLVIGQLQFLTNMHPMIQVNNTKRQVLAYGQRFITAFDQTGTNVCLLCETLPTLDNGLAKIVNKPDGSKGMTVQINLKPGLKWGDGIPVTSKDIAFTWKIASDPQIGFSNYNPWNRATKVDIVNDRSVIMHLERPVTGYNSWDNILPEHIEGPIYAANPTARAYAQQSAYNRAPTTPGLWNGPFMFTDYQVGTRIVMDANPYWPGPGPNLKRIILSYRDNSAALIQNVLSGDMDAVPVSPGGISFSQMLDMRKQYPQRYNYLVAQGTNLERIAINFDNPLLADVRIRRAILHAIDRKAITEALFDNLQSVANSIFADNSPLYSKDVVLYPFDLAKAKALIAEAGYKPGPDKICANAAGEKLTFEFVTTAGNQTREQIAQVVQSQLAEACIQTVIKLVPLTEFNGVQARERKFTGLMLSSIDFPPSASPRIVFGSDAIPTAANNFVGNNFSGYKNPEMDKAIVVAEGVLPQAEEKAAWAKVQRIFSEDLPILPIYYYARAYVAVKDLVDFEFGTLDSLGGWAEAWRRP